MFYNWVRGWDYQSLIHCHPYHVHEKIVNFMAPEPMNIPPMVPKLFENLFGLKTPKLASVT
ncbi:putative apoptosis-antagonizing transcription factor, protein AATF/Bfr2 [Helianthus anomalus]